MTVGNSNFKPLPNYSPKCQEKRTPASEGTLHYLTMKSSTTTTTSTADDRSEIRDSCYFPGCRKDANCNCEMCLDSISATLDLLPASVQRSTLTKLSAPKTVERTPVSFNSSVMSTPESGTTGKTPASPSVRSTARLGLKEKMKKRKREGRLGLYFWKFFLGFGLIFAMEFGFSCGVARVLRPKLSWEIVRSIGEGSGVIQDLNGKMGYLQKRLQGFVGAKVSNCSYIDSKWEVNQDGLLLNSRCTLYKSVTEEVAIWGWPLQTAGLLATGLSSRSFTILSGGVTEVTLMLLQINPKSDITFSLFEFIWGSFSLSLCLGVTVARWEDPEFDSEGKQFLDTEEMECVCGAIRFKYENSRVPAELYFGKFEIGFSGSRVVESLDL